MARENLDITVIVFANRSYGALGLAYKQLGLGEPGPLAASLFDLTNPELNFVDIAKGLGVEAMQSHSVEDFASHVAYAMTHNGPHLIEAVLA